MYHILTLRHVRNFDFQKNRHALLLSVMTSQMTTKIQRISAWPAGAFHHRSTKPLHPTSQISTKPCLWGYLGRWFSLWHFQPRQSNGLRDIARGNFQVPIKTNIFISRYLIKGLLDCDKYLDWNNFNEPNLYLTKYFFEKIKMLNCLHFLEILKMILQYVAI